MKATVWLVQLILVLWPGKGRSKKKAESMDKTVMTHEVCIISAATHIAVKILSPALPLQITCAPQTSLASLLALHVGWLLLQSHTVL